MGFSIGWVSAPVKGRHHVTAENYRNANRRIGGIVKPVNLAGWVTALTRISKMGADVIPKNKSLSVDVIRPLFRLLFVSMKAARYNPSFNREQPNNL